MKTWLAVAAVLLLTARRVSALSKMDVVHSWKTVDYVFPSSDIKSAMLRTRAFIPENVALIDVDVWENPEANQQKIFVTMPRLKAGIPATLATVGLTGLLSPYPSWNWHQEGDCEGITSVFRIDIDKCGRLWVLDSGNVEIFTDAKRICPPQILVFDLYSDRLLDRYRIPEENLDPKSLLVTISVDARGPKCQDTFAYIADVVGYRLIVFDATNERSWRANNRFFYPYPTSALFDINEVVFELTDGVLGLALGPVNNYGDRKLYFHSFASHKENWVYTSVLRNRTLLTEGDTKLEFKLLEGTRNSQSAAEAMTPSGILFFGLVTENSIACWNSRLSYSEDNIIRVAKCGLDIYTAINNSGAHKWFINSSFEVLGSEEPMPTKREALPIADNERLQFVGGVKIRNGFLWGLSSKFQNYITNRLNPRGINYRIVAGSLAILTHGTSCHYPVDSFVFHQSYHLFPYDKTYSDPFSKLNAALCSIDDGCLEESRTDIKELLVYQHLAHIYIEKDKKTLQFASGLKVRSDKLWALTSRLQNYIGGSVPVGETNYRVLTGGINHLTRSTKCYRTQQGSSETLDIKPTFTLGFSGSYKPFVFSGSNHQKNPKI